MAQVSHLLSDNITTREATPIVQSSAGEGAPGRLIHVDGLVTSVAADSAHSLYSFLRVPSNAKLKSLLLTMPAGGGSAAIDFGLFYVAPGIAPGQTASRVYNSAGQAKNGVIQLDYFASAVVVTNAIARVDITNESTNHTTANRQKPLWAAAGLAKDPGGYFDIVGHVTVEVANAVALYLEAEYVQ